MTKISDLPTDLVKEIMRKVPLENTRAVRLTCKTWDSVWNKSGILEKKIQSGIEAPKEEGESRMVLLKDYKLYLTSFFLNDVDHPTIEHKGKLTSLNGLDKVSIAQVFHCDGLLLCILKDDPRFVVWNPYLGQTRWIEPRFSCSPFRNTDLFSYALGYKNENESHSFKFLRFIDHYVPTTRPRRCSMNQVSVFEIYDFDSDMWKTLDVDPYWRIRADSRSVSSVSIKGNTYWCATERNSPKTVIDHIISFDFSSERFGKLLSLPFYASDYDVVTLSCVGQGKLAALHFFEEDDTVDIWITTELETQKVSWSKFMILDMDQVPDVGIVGRSFFIDESRKAAVLFDKTFSQGNTVAIAGEAGHFTEFDLEEADDDCYSLLRGLLRVCSYVPSSVQIKQPERHKRKRENSSLECSRFKHKMSRLAQFITYVNAISDSSEEQASHVF